MKSIICGTLILACANLGESTIFSTDSELHNRGFEDHPFSSNSGVLSDDRFRNNGLRNDDNRLNGAVRF